MVAKLSEPLSSSYNGLFKNTPYLYHRYTKSLCLNVYMFCSGKVHNLLMFFSEVMDYIRSAKRRLLIEADEGDIPQMLGTGFFAFEDGRHFDNLVGNELS